MLPAKNAATTNARLKRVSISSILALVFTSFLTLVFLGDFDDLEAISKPVLSK